MNKQHVFDKFDIIYEFYNVKKTFISAVLQWEIERKLVVLTLALLWSPKKNQAQPGRFVVSFCLRGKDS